MAWVGYREIGVGVVARALICASVSFIRQDVRGRLEVTTWDDTGGAEEHAGSEAMRATLTRLPVLHPALDAEGALVLTVRAPEDGLAGWRMVGAVAYVAADIDVAARMVPVLADPAMLASEPRHTAHTAGVLTARESEVLTLVGLGLTAKAVARRCGISERTVHKHLEQAYRKLDCHDRLSAVLLARDNCLLTGRALAGTT